MSMANDDKEGCWGCLGLIIILVVISGIIAAVQAYAAAIRTERVVYGVLTAVPTGLIAGGLVGLIAGKYRQKVKLGPLPFFSYLRSTSGLRRTYLPSSVPAPPPDQSASSEEAGEAEAGEAEAVQAEVVEEEAGDAQNACPQCGFNYKWDGTRCGHCHYVATSH
jgi:hypothetical protein